MGVATTTVATARMPIVKIFRFCMGKFLCDGPVGPLGLNSHLTIGWGWISASPAPFSGCGAWKSSGHDGAHTGGCGVAGPEQPREAVEQAGRGSFLGSRSHGVQALGGLVG